jgi:hypothetical protein
MLSNIVTPDMIWTSFFQGFVVALKPLIIYIGSALVTFFISKALFLILKSIFIYLGDKKSVARSKVNIIQNVCDTTTAFKDIN